MYTCVVSHSVFRMAVFVAGIWSSCCLLTLPASALEIYNKPIVIQDTDVDFDDTVALAALAELHLSGEIDLRAVTITNNGAGLPGKAYLHVRCLLDSLGLQQIPVADATYNLPHAFPSLLRSTIDIVLDQSIPDCPAGHIPANQTASDLLADTLRNARGPVTLVATGPLTNVALALSSLSRDSGVVPASIVVRVFAQNGAVRVPGGLSGVSGFDNSQELNAWGDPAAAQTVFTLIRPGSLFLVPLDATNFVPITQPYIATLTARSETSAAQYVARLMNNPILQGAIQAGLPIFWWDPLTAIAATHPEIVDFDRDRISVIQDGVSSGRTIEDPNGSLMWVGFSANTALFGQRLLDVLNGFR